MCFGDWSRNDYITNTELEAFLNDKGKGDEILVVDDDDDDDDD